MSRKHTARRRVTGRRHLRHLYGGRGEPLAAIPPRPAPLLLSLLRVLGPLYRRWGMGIARVVVEGTGPLMSMLRATDTKFIFAFRHPSVDDPPVVYSVLHQLLHEADRNTPRRRTPVFLYGRDVPVWGGALVEWILPRIGAISVFHQQMNRESLDAVYAAFRENALPIALAPEAQVTYHNYRVAPTQRGVAHLSLEAARARGPVAPAAPADGTPPVLIVPMGLEYRYPDRGDRQFRSLIDRISRELMPPGDTVSTEPITRLWELYDHIFRILEAHYGISYQDHGQDQAGSDTADRYNARAGKIIESALAAGERAAGLDLALGTDPISRVFGLRRHYWEQRFPPYETTSLGDKLRDISAMEARSTARHFQIVDVMAYLDFTYLAEVRLIPGAPMPAAGSAPHARLVEYLLSVEDIAGRSLGHTIGERYLWRRRYCTVRFGEPLTVGPPAGRTDRAAATTRLQGEIESALTALSVDHDA